MPRGAGKSRSKIYHVAVTATTEIFNYIEMYYNTIGYIPELIIYLPLNMKIVIIRNKEAEQNALSKILKYEQLLQTSTNFKWWIRLICL